MRHTSQHGKLTINTARQKEEGPRPFPPTGQHLQLFEVSTNATCCAESCPNVSVSANGCLLPHWCRLHPLCLRRFCSRSPNSCTFHGKGQRCVFVFLSGSVFNQMTIKDLNKTQSSHYQKSSVQLTLEQI